MILTPYLLKKENLAFKGPNMNFTNGYNAKTRKFSAKTPKKKSPKKLMAKTRKFQAFLRQKYFLHKN